MHCNGDMTISSWRRQLRVSFEVSITFSRVEVTENGGVILWEETIVPHGRWTNFEANSGDGGEESFQDEACDDDDVDEDDDDDVDEDDDDDDDDEEAEDDDDG